MEINNKLRVFIALLVIVFMIIVFKFLIVTNYYSAGYTQLASYQTDVIVENPLPRGEIFDVKDRLLVGNKQSKNLIYMKSPNIDNDYEWEVAKDLVDNIDPKKITYNFQDVDFQDVVIAEDSMKFYNRVIDDEDTYGELKTDEEVGEAMRKSVTKEDYKELEDKYGKDSIKVKILMNTSSTSSPKTIFEDLSTEEEYYVRAHQGELGGSFIIDNWERTYPYKDTLRVFLGNVGDIPKEEVTKYESLGYSSSDQVGVSYVEEEQEQYLRAKPAQMQIYYDNDGNIVNYNTINDGEPGKDIKLTIDMELQKKVDKILKSTLDNDSYRFFKTAYASVMDVDTGDIIVIAGKYIDNEKDIEYDNSIGNFTTAYEVGSIVKPIILLMGYQQGVWDYGQIVDDKPMELGGASVKASYTNNGRIDENTAIAKSSNVYFYTMALKIAGIEYGVDQLPAEVDEESFNILRNGFSEFGLGSKTGIDFKEEIAGYTSNDRGVGLYMDMANGQYDTYTPIEMTQYMATMANGKARYKANYLYSINEAGEVGELGKEIRRNSKVVLNYLDFDEKDIKHVQNTLMGPSQYGTTVSAADPRYKFASKSGTAESFALDEDTGKTTKTDNSSFIAYAPYDKPKIAVSVLLPYWTKDGEVLKRSSVDVGGDVLDACYDEGYI